MNTTELAQFDDWDESELEALVAGFVRSFRRLPHGEELACLGESRAGAHLRVPLRGRRVIAGVISRL